MKEKLEFGLALAVIGMSVTMVSLVILGFLASLLNKVFSGKK